MLLADNGTGDAFEIILDEKENPFCGEDAVEGGDRNENPDLVVLTGVCDAEGAVIALHLSAFFVDLGLDIDGIFGNISCNE